MRKKIGPIIIIVLSLFLAAVFGVLLTNNYVSALEEFPNDGYILVANKDNSSDAINDQRYFESGTTYKKAYDGSIVFNDINDDKVSIDSKNFVHYSNNSLSSLDDTVLLDTDKLDETQISYYAISSRSTLTKTSDSYTTENVGTGNLNFKNFVWKISEQRYMLVSNTIILVVSETSKQSFSNYIELQYIDEGIAYLVNQDGTYSTISSDAYLLLDNGVRIYIGSKNVSDEEQVLVNLTQMVVDSDDNIEVIPDEDYNIESNEQPQIVVNANDGADGKAGEAGEEGNPGELGNKGNQGTAGSPGTQGNPGNTGENAEGYGLNFEPETLPKFSLTSDGLEVTAYSVNGTILFDSNGCIMANDEKRNKDGSLEEGYPATFMIINDSDGSIVWLRHISYNDLNEFDGNLTAEKQINHLTDSKDENNKYEPVSTLRQNTTYTFAINSSFSTDGENFITQQVFQQQFTTDSYGMNLVFNQSTTDSLSYTVNISKETAGTIESINVELFDAEQKKININYNNEYEFSYKFIPGDVLSKNNDGTFLIPSELENDTTIEIKYFGSKIQRNSTYYARINVACSETPSVIPSSSFEYVIGKTLKITPTVGKPSAVMSEMSNSFIVSPGTVTDYDSGITGYRYDFYDIVKNGTDEVYTLAYSYNTNTLDDFSVPVNELQNENAKASNTLYRGCEYVVKQIAIFNNNLNIEEIESVYSERFSSSSLKQRPTASFELSLYPNEYVEKAGQSPASLIDGKLNIVDTYNTIPKSAIITITYESTTNVEHVYEKEYTKLSSYVDFATNTYYVKVSEGNYALLKTKPLDWDSNFSNYYQRSKTYDVANKPISGSYSIYIADCMQSNNKSYSIQFAFNALKSETTYNINAYINELVVNGSYSTGETNKGVLLGSTSTTTSKYTELYVSSFGVDDYALLTSVPNDWNVNDGYTKYYTCSGTVNNNDQWESGKIYYKYEDTWVLTLSQPSDWSSNYDKTYYRLSFNNIAKTSEAPNFSAGIYYTTVTKPDNSQFDMNICFSQDPELANKEYTNRIIFTNYCKNKYGLVDSYDLSIKSLSYVTFDVYTGTLSGNIYTPTQKVNNVSLPIYNTDTYNLSDKHEYASLYKFNSNFNRSAYKVDTKTLYVGSYLNNYYSDGTLSNTPIDDLSKYYIKISSKDFPGIDDALNNYLTKNDGNDIKPYVFVKCSAAYDYTYGCGGTDWSNTNCSDTSYMLYQYGNSIPIGKNSIGDSFTNNLYDKWLTSSINAARPDWQLGTYFDLNNHVIYKNFSNNNINSGNTILQNIKDNFASNKIDYVSNLYSTFDLATAVSTDAADTNSKLVQNSLFSSITNLSNYWTSDENDIENIGVSKTVVGYYVQGPKWIASYSLAVRYIIYENVYDSSGKLISQVEVTKSYNDCSSKETDDVTDGWIYYDNSYLNAHDNNLPGYYFFLDTKSVYKNIGSYTCDSSVSRGEPFSVRMQVKLSNFKDSSGKNEIYPSDAGEEVKNSNTGTFTTEFFEENACSEKQKPKINLIQYDGNNNIDTRYDYFYANIRDLDNTLNYRYILATGDNPSADSWPKNTYYSKKELIDYLPLIKKPSNWSESYKNYYIKKYENVGGSSAPTWTENTFYELDGNDYKLTTKQPADWSTTYNNYFVAFVKVNSASAPEWSINTYYAITTISTNYEVLNEKPDDWDYGIGEGAYYFKRKGIIAYDSNRSNQTDVINIDYYSFNNDDEATSIGESGTGFDRNVFCKLGTILNSTNLTGNLLTDYDIFSIRDFSIKDKFTHSSNEYLILVNENNLSIGSTFESHDFDLVSITPKEDTNKFVIEISVNKDVYQFINKIDVTFNNKTFIKLSETSAPNFESSGPYFIKNGEDSYSQLNVKPDDWNSNYNNYYKKIKYGQSKLIENYNKSYSTDSEKLTIEVKYTDVSSIAEASSTDFEVKVDCYYATGNYGIKYTKAVENYYILEDVSNGGVKSELLKPNGINKFTNINSFTGATYNINAIKYNSNDSNDARFFSVAYTIEGLNNVPREIAKITNTGKTTLTHVFSNAELYSEKNKIGRNFVTLNAVFQNLGTLLNDNTYSPKIYYREHVDGDNINPISKFDEFESLIDGWKEITNYSLTTSAPTNWNESFASYYTVSNSVYSHVSGVSPTWVSGKFYSYDGTSYSIINNTIAPDDWGDCSNYYVYDLENDTYNSVEKVAPTWENGIYYKQVGGSTHSVPVTDITETNKSSYITIDGLNYNTYYDFVLVGSFKTDDNTVKEIVLAYLENDSISDEGNKIKTLTNLNFDYDNSKLYTEWYRQNRDQKYLCLNVNMNQVFKNDIKTGLVKIYADVFIMLKNASEPSDWASNKTNYYKAVYQPINYSTVPTFADDMYYVNFSKVSGTKPEWTANTYYSRSNYNFTLTTIQPTDWDDNWTNYYINNGYTLVEKPNNMNSLEWKTWWTNNYKNCYLKNFVKVESTDVWYANTYYKNIASAVTTKEQLLSALPNTTVEEDKTLKDYVYKYYGTNNGFNFVPDVNLEHEINGVNEYIARVTFEYNTPANSNDRYQYNFIYEKLDPWINTSEGFFRVIGSNKIETNSNNYQIDFTISGSDMRKIVASDNIDDLNSAVFVAELHRVYETTDSNNNKISHDVVVDINNDDSIYVKESNEANSPVHKVNYIKTYAPNGKINSVDVKCNYLNPGSVYYLKVYACIDYTNIDKIPSVVSEYQISTESSKPADFTSNYYKAVYTSVSNDKPTWSYNKFYSYKNGKYTMLETKPSDWSSASSTYYKLSFSPVGTSDPWYPNTYYRKMVSVSYSPVSGTTEPNDWLYNWSCYYVKDSNDVYRINTSEIWDINTKYYVANVSTSIIFNGYIQLTSQPDNWSDNYGKYYVKENGEYVLNKDATWDDSKNYYSSKLISDLNINGDELSINENKRITYNHTYASSKITTPTSGGIMVYGIVMDPSKQNVLFMGSGLGSVKKIKYSLTLIGDESETPYDEVTLIRSTNVDNSKNIYQLGLYYQEDPGSAGNGFTLNVPNLNKINSQYYMYISIYDSLDENAEPVSRLEGSYVPKIVNTTSSPNMLALTRNALNDTLTNAIGNMGGE